MALFKPVVNEFHALKPVTMTIIIPYDVDELNLSAIFALLPVTKRVLPANYIMQKKQNKIRLPPELNQPGEILSMRFDKQVRGIIRSEEAMSFSHSIIMDIGTSDRIISAKFARASIELTGPRSHRIALQAARAILDKIKECQSNLLLVRNNPESAIRMKRAIINPEEKITPNNEIEEKIYNFFIRTSHGYSNETIPDFLDFILSLNKDIYTGTLNVTSLEYHMVNILFNLGFSINQVEFVKVMNHPPFESSYTNLKCTPNIIVVHKYTKIDGKIGKHTIRVNKSGHVRYSGPNLDSMRLLYYIFMQRIILNYKKIRSVIKTKCKLQMYKSSKEYTINEYMKILKKEEKIRRRIVNTNWPVPLDPYQIYMQEIENMSKEEGMGQSIHENLEQNESICDEIQPQCQRQSENLTPENNGEMTAVSNEKLLFPEIQPVNINTQPLTSNLSYIQFNYGPLLSDNCVLVA